MQGGQKRPYFSILYMSGVFTFALEAIMIDKKGCGKMTQKKYKWQFDRLVALLVALGNCMISVLILIKVMKDDQFFKMHTGINLNLKPWQSLWASGFIVVLVLICNYVFLKKNYRAWMFLGLCQTLIFAFVIRNIFLIVMYDFNINLSWFQNLGLLFYMGGLIYLTLFSSHVMTYFKLQKKSD